VSPRTVTLELPGLLYQQLAHRAAEAHRSVEAELLDVVATAVPALDETPAELGDVVSTLAALDDEELLRAAGSRMPEPLAARLEELNWKQQATGLTETESDEAARLVGLYERTLLVRASAAKFLKDRGRDLPPVHLEE